MKLVHYPTISKNALTFPFLMKLSWFCVLTEKPVLEILCLLRASELFLSSESGIKSYKTKNAVNQTKKSKYFTGFIIYVHQSQSFECLKGSKRAALLELTRYLIAISMQKKTVKPTILIKNLIIISCLISKTCLNN